MKHLRILLALLAWPALLAGLSGCGGTAEKDPLLTEAYDLHTAAVKARKEVGQALKAGKEKLTQTDDSTSLARIAPALAAVESALAKWDSQLVEVPGFEHDHDHDHGDHDHHHNPVPNLTPEQHRDVQQSLLEEIGQIKKLLEAAN